MGYTTDFCGQFDLDKPLTPEHKAYLAAFADTRRMKRNPVIVEGMQDDLRKAVGLPEGVEGGYYVGSEGKYGQDNDESVVEYNQHPTGQPGLWCQWVPNKDGTAIVWDENEKFYYYVEWIEYIIEHFLKPWGYVVNGKVNWHGEGWYDTGAIRIEDNIVVSAALRVSQPPEM